MNKEYHRLVSQSTQQYKIPVKRECLELAEGIHKMISIHT